MRKIGYVLFALGLTIDLRRAATTPPKLRSSNSPHKLRPRKPRPHEFT